VSLRFVKTFSVCVQLRENRLQPVNVHVQDSLKELAADFFKSNLQLRCNSPSFGRGLDDQEPVIARVALTPQKAACLEPVDEARDLTLVPTHGFGNFSRGNVSFFHAMQQHRRFLRRHSEWAETTIEGRLQPYAGTEEPR